MVELTRLITPAVVQAYDFTGCRRIIDVGGGHGELLVAILQASRGVRVLFDMPHVIAQGQQHLARADLAHRCECVAGDFLESVPGGGDAYVLKSILHNWNDAQSTRILDNCRRAMPVGQNSCSWRGLCRSAWASPLPTRHTHAWTCSG